ncbi:hypothetical protein AAIA72_12040 [Hahella sp. SMD15-11]|uniref:Cytochrome oxidase assembly protein n=1 Tax=Thermohahella caldifontis TaxID=3142973 RepID=A0AB39UU36_9GAMM
MTPHTSPAHVHFRFDKIKLTALWAVALAPVLAAWIMYFGQWAVPDGRVNKGRLITPMFSLGEVMGAPEDAAFWPRQADGKRAWLLAVYSEGPCLEACREQALKMRQVNVALGKDQTRVVRRFLGEAVPVDHAVAPTLTLSPEQQTRLRAQLRAAGIELRPLDRLVVDPHGNVVLHYQASQPAEDTLKDLRRLLKLSKIG